MSVTHDASISFLALHSVIHPRAVTEFIYRYNLNGESTKAHILVSIKLDGTQPREEEVKGLFAALKAEDMDAMDLSDDELAKSHARYMIGGPQSVEHERIFRFRTC